MGGVCNFSQESAEGFDSQFLILRRFVSQGGNMKRAKKKGNKCAEWVKNEALKCRFCAFDFAAASRQQPASQARK